MLLVVGHLLAVSVAFPLRAPVRASRFVPSRSRVASSPHASAPFALSDLTSTDLEALEPLQLAQLLQVVSSDSSSPGLSSRIAANIAEDQEGAEAVLGMAIELGWPAAVALLLKELDTVVGDAPEGEALHVAAQSILDLSASLCEQRPLDGEEAEQAEADSMIAALLTRAPATMPTVVDALAHALCDRACVLTDALVVRGREAEARDMLIHLLPILPADTPSEGVMLALAILHRRDGDEDAVEAVSKQILASTDWMYPAESEPREDAASVPAMAVAADADSGPTSDEPLALLDPTTLVMLRIRANALCLLREYEGAFEVLRRSARSSRHMWAAGDSPVSRYKLMHDAAQVAHLRTSGAIDADEASAAKEAYAAALDSMDDAMNDSMDEDDDAASPLMTLDALPDEAQQLLVTPSHIPSSIATTWQGRVALRPRSGESWAALERAYVDEDMIVIDDFLTDEALVHLRALANGATLWHDDKGHYVGAYDFAGFAPSCIARLADELTAALPAVIGHDTLNRFWGYKYEARPSGASAIGIGAHIDPARANFNFWVTPDDANLDATSGGMVVWRKKSSADDDASVRRLYNTFCADEEACGELERALGLDDPAIERIVVPYRCNRCVLFSSELYHKTDQSVFKPEYTCSRINLTMLFGYASALRAG